MRAPVYNLYQMKSDRLPHGVGSAWLRTQLDQPPQAADDWVFVGKERHPSKWTVAAMTENGSCYLEIPSWLARRGTDFQAAKALGRTETYSSTTLKNEAGARKIAPRPVRSGLHAQ